MSQQWPVGHGYQTIDGGKTFSELDFDGRDVRDFYFLNDDISFRVRAFRVFGAL